MAENCKNCTNPVTENFCGNCGQKTTVHRYSIKHFIEHDLIHGIWHVDKGILFTIKVLFIRPGHSIREFINGKRVGYFSFITLLIIILGVSHFVSEYSQVKLSDLMPDGGKGAMNDLEDFTKKYPKFTLLLTIPGYSVFSFLWFRKAKLNFTEHFVLNSYKTVAELLIGLIFTLITVFYSNLKVLAIIYSFIGLFTIIYTYWYYRQYFSVYGFSKKSLIARCIGVVFSYLFFHMAIGVFMANLKYGK
jgi:hypothetical protein